MRIAMTSPYDLSVPGGVQGQVVGLSAALRALGHDVVTIAPGPPGTGPELVSVGRSIGVRANGSVAPVALSPAAAFRGQRALRARPLDVVHLHEPLAPTLNYGCLLVRGLPVVGTFHRSGGKALYRSLAPLVRFATGRLDARCAVSEPARAMVAPYCRGDIEVVFNGVAVDRLRDAVPVATNGPTVLFVGRHERRKGLAVLLEAVAQMPEPPMVWVAGTGPETATLMAAYPPSARRVWLGAIDENEKSARMAGADVLCAPSLGGESFGIVLLEGMAANCAVVASDIDGYRQAAGGHARLVPPGDPAALRSALQDVVAEVAGGTDRQNGRRAAAEYVARWSMSALARRYVEVYEAVLEPSATGRPSGRSQVA